MYQAVDMEKHQAVEAIAINVLCLRNEGNLSVSQIM
jgi:hypothetical protein